VTGHGRLPLELPGAMVVADGARDDVADDE
jgi:hypothetical protein